MGIIGVVASLTIPPLVQKHRQTVAETRLKKFYSEINQAVQMSEIDNGDKRDWDFENENCVGNNSYSKECLEHNFNKFFKPYLRYTNMEYSTNYYGDNGGGLIVYFSNGSAMVMSYMTRDVQFFPVGSCVKKENRKQDKDFFFFGLYPAGVFGERGKYFINKGIEPYIWSSWNGNDENLPCLKRTQMNGWKFPDDCNPFK